MSSCGRGDGSSHVFNRVGSYPGGGVDGSSGNPGGDRVPYYLN